MTDPGVPHDDMLSVLWRSGMDVPQDRGPGEDAALPCPVADVLAALRAAPSHGELTGLDPVLTEPRRTAPAQQAVAFTPRPGHTPAGKHKGKGKAASR